MLRRTLCLLVVVLVAASVGAFAADSKGRWGNHEISATEVSLPDGRTALITHYYEVFHAENPSDPLNDVGGDCSGKMIMDGETTLSGSGVCFIKDADGDGMSLWWRVTEAGTRTCPISCGEYGFFDGYGKFRGVKGSGTWQNMKMFEGGATGWWKGTVSMK